MARPLRDRLLHELDSIRNELIETISSLSKTDLDFAPRDGMKGYRALLIEIGAMEAESSILIRTGRVPEWSESESYVKGESVAELLESLAAIRQDLRAHIDQADEAELARQIPIPEEWWSFIGDSEIEVEELLRWVARHEYYHLGQIITYRWIQGNNPYRADQPRDET
jgi:hypothetical protein